MTKKEREHMDKVARLGCMACLNQGTYSPAGIHHVRHDGNGGNLKRDHFKTIGICSPHHQNHGQGVSIHDGLESWEAVHGSEWELLEQVYGLLGLELCRETEG